MKLVGSGRELIKFTVPLNLWSFGERVTVVLGSVEGYSFVDITSSCVLRTQIADWGKNERNVRRLFDEIDKILGNENDNEHARSLLCGECGYLLVGIPGGVCPECGHEYSPNDRPRKQEVATLKNATALGLVTTAFELALSVLLDQLGAGGFLPWMLYGVRGAAALLLFNLGVLFGLVGLHRIVMRYTRRC